MVITAVLFFTLEGLAIQDISYSEPVSGYSLTLGTSNHQVAPTEHSKGQPFRNQVTKLSPIESKVKAQELRSYQC